MEAGALRAPAALNRITVTSPLLRLRSDEQLVALFRAGNDAAFGVIHDRYRQRLFAYARQMLGGSRQDAEDAMQDVFLRAYASLRCSDRPLSLRAWLYRVAHNRCIDQLRKPMPPVVDLFDMSRKPLHDPIAEAESREDLRQLVADVRRLPEQQRSALLMRELDGLSYAELADALGATLPAVKSLLVRARIGLVEAVEARATACSEIRLDLVSACDRGVRPSGRTRRHLRDCAGCVEYRRQLRGLSTRLGALMPNPGLAGTVLKLLGLGGAGSAGAASAGGGAAAGGGAMLAASSGTIAKVAAVVCCAALTAGGAAEVRTALAPPARHAPDRTAAIAPAAAAAQTAAVRYGAPLARSSRPRSAHAAALARKRAAREHATIVADVVAPMLPAAATAASDTDSVTGGARAPDEETGFGDGASSQTPAADATGSPAAIDEAPAPSATQSGDRGSHDPGLSEQPAAR
jgi:RNA polymerase sigma factor (sigma-70 family)